MAEDPLSDLLRAVRFRGAVFYDVEGTAPWVAEAPPAATLLPGVMPDVDHLMEFHGVLRGACWAARTGEPAVRLEEGDLVLFPHGDGHVMSSAPGLRAARLDPETLVPARGDRLPLPLTVDAAGVARPRLRSEGRDATRLVCGFLGCDARPFNPLLAALPRVLVVPGAAEAGSWSAALLRGAVEESSALRPGGAAVLEKMSEMLFVAALRHHADGLATDAPGWLAGLRDATVGSALARLHARPGEPWTLERLCEETHTSRSTLHERFVHFVGLPPMTYLTRWRMQVASRLLREGRHKVARIALDVGYESEAAFARAFKRLVGATPGAWRTGVAPRAEATRS